MNNIKLFCIPHLGGSAANYYQWKLFFYDKIEICPIELAGRGERNKEPFYENFKEMILDVAEHIIQEKPKTYAFWGHSMGALIAYETSYNLLSQGFSPPAHIFFSGRNTPDIKDDIFFSNMNDETLLNKLNQIGGIPSAIYDYPELMSLFFSTVKADYTIMSTYGFNLHKSKLKSDISIFAGDTDITILYEKMYKWKLLTEKECNIHYFPGNHFYIEDNIESIFKLINQTLNKYL